MALLFKNLRVHQVFGSNTGVGKTVIINSLIRASASRKKQVFYLKPVSTGPLEEADDFHVRTYSENYRHLVRTACLFRYDEPVSPHLAVERALRKSGTEHQRGVPSDHTLASSISSHVKNCASQSKGDAHMYIETAGGVHSPTLSGSSQAECYRALFLPTILIGDSKLGGISATISSYESLLLRGYIVDAILLFREDYYRNWEYLTAYFAEKGIPVYTTETPPPISPNSDMNFALTEEFYLKTTSSEHSGGILKVVDHLTECHNNRISELESMAQRTLDSIWWPFVQHSHVKGSREVSVIDSAHSDFFAVLNQRATVTAKSSLLEPLLDGSASWWTQALGHAHSSLTLAAARAAGRYGHVMFPQATHLPALNLAETLLKDGPGKGWASRAFFSDNGSTGMEVALKMALRAFAVKQELNLDPKTKKDLGVVGLRGSYHGDTIGAMDACEEGVYTSEWHNAKGFWFDPPTLSVKNGRAMLTLPRAIAKGGGFEEEEMALEGLPWAYTLSKRLDSSVAHFYRQFITDTLREIQKTRQAPLATLVLEPIAMGAGGMVFVDPLFQRIMVDVVRESYGLPVIFDEVFVGLYRLGFQSSMGILGVNPDISVNAKILTGGLVPLAVTLASDEIFQSFWSDGKTDALLHGHSYTAHAVGCEVANETMKIIEKLKTSRAWKDAQDKWGIVCDRSSAGTEGGTGDCIWSFWDPSFLDALSRLDIVKDVMALGTVLALKFDDKGIGYSSFSAQKLLEAIKLPSESDNISAAPGGAPFGIHFRTLGDVAYFMTSLNTETAIIRSVEERIWKTLCR